MKSGMPAATGGHGSRSYAPGKGSASSAPTASPFRNRTPPRGLGAGAGRTGFSAWPEFFCRAQLQPVDDYALALLHLGDSCVGGEPFVQKFPGSEPPRRSPKSQEIQRRLTALGFDTGGADGRIGNDTMLAVRDFQRKAGMEPADGYAGVKLFARLRQGS
jgi:membrane-bound lytic murein transglycosylase B